MKAKQDTNHRKAISEIDERWDWRDLIYLCNLNKIPLNNWTTTLFQDS